jgi:putative ubiquitin-RnfH superfamily antitoxin RatB of RatAB toxin-antitoxin module
MKVCWVVFALPHRQWQWRVQLEDSASVDEVLRRARAQSDAQSGAAEAVDVPWEADVGIFGEPCDRAAIPRDGDRIEIYRPLRSDPKVSRRARAAAGKAAPGPASARPRSAFPPTKPTR